MPDDEGREEFPVAEVLGGERVDRAVAFLTGWSRADVQDLVSRGAVLVDGEPVGKSRRLRAGELVTVVERPAVESLPEPDPGVEVDVRYEDGDVAVMAKPAGLVVHPGAGHPTGTLVHGLLARYPSMASVGDPVRPGIVHRLDRGTSGLMVVALTQPAYEALVALLAAREVERRYLALVWGAPELDRGVVDAPVGRSQRRPTRMAVTPAGREARTRYEVRERFPRPETALLDVALDTGRTHQIRVHLAAIGHPVVGDAAYGGARGVLGLDRPFLHAYHLAFRHPIEGRRVEVRDQLPADLEAILTGLRHPA